MQIEIFVLKLLFNFGNDKNTHTYIIYIYIIRMVLKKYLNIRYTYQY